MLVFIFYVISPLIQLFFLIVFRRMVEVQVFEGCFFRQKIWEWDISISTKSNPEQLYVHTKKNSYNCLCFFIILRKKVCGNQPQPEYTSLSMGRAPSLLILNCTPIVRHYLQLEVQFFCLNLLRK